jgi:carboxylesterase
MPLKLIVSSRAGSGEKPSCQGYALKGTAGGSVLLIHGLTGTPAEMFFLSGFLNRKGYSVSCPCLANHGRHINILKRTTWQQCYDSVKQALGEITEGPVFACGLSMGALLALQLSIDFTGRIAGVCAISPTLFYDGWNIPWYRRFLPLAYVWPLRYFLFWKEGPPYGIKNATLREIVDRQYRAAEFDDISGVARYGYPYFPISLLYQLELLVRHVIPRLQEVTVPVQLIQALEDDMTGISNSQFIYDSVCSQTKEFALFTDSYHVITADQERQEAANKISAFFLRCLEERGLPAEAAGHV